jgi:hypothetical protein
LAVYPRTPGKQDEKLVSSVCKPCNKAQDCNLVISRTHGVAKRRIDVVGG